MMDEKSIFDEIWNDLAQAKSFQSNGESGKSRVCARKAAGKAVRFHLSQLFPETNLSMDPFSAIVTFQNTIDKDDPLYKHLENLQLRVNKDFTFSEEIDLIFSAETIIKNIISRGSNQL